MRPSRRSMMLVYSRKDKKFLEHSKFIDFLESLVEQEKLELWWDRKISRSLFDEEIRFQLGRAHIIICLVSESFLVSKYIRDVESKITEQRLRKEGTVVVPILLEDCSWEQYGWLKHIQHVPDKPIIPHHNHDRAQTFKSIIDHIRSRIRGKSRYYHEPRALYTLRRLPDSAFSKEERRILVVDSSRRARRYVPDSKVREKICRAARLIIQKNGGTSLGKKNLELLDKRFIAKGIRKADAESIRWVLRSARLHPQGRGIIRIWI